MPGAQEEDPQGPHPRGALAGVTAAAVGEEHENEYTNGTASLDWTERWLGGRNGDAATSLRAGLEETLTAVRLGVEVGVW